MTSRDEVWKLISQILENAGIRNAGHSANRWHEKWELLLPADEIMYRAHIVYRADEHRVSIEAPETHRGAIWVRALMGGLEEKNVPVFFVPGFIPAPAEDIF